MWRIKNNKPVRLDRSAIGTEKDLEELIKADPSLLDQESLLIIGQQAEVIDVGDEIDLLAIDPQGTPVIIEVKKGKVKSPDEMQSIRYASYVANWGHESFEKQADSFFSQKQNTNLLPKYVGRNEAKYEGFIQLLEEFCEEDYELNSDQRIIIVGADIREKVLPVLFWLNKKGIDIKYVQIRAFNDEEDTYVFSKTVFPLPEHEDLLVGTSATAVTKPWKVDGRAWHLQKRSSPESAKILNDLVDILASFDEVESVSWKQKFYVAIKIRTRIWTSLKVFPNQVNVKMRIARNSISVDDCRAIVSLPMDRISIEEKGPWDRIKIKLRVEDDYDSEAFKTIARKALASYLSETG